MRALKEEKYDKPYDTNEAEKVFVDTAREQGWIVTKRGYPDVICYKNGDVMLVEVKRRRKYRLKSSQSRFMGHLSKYGVKCYKWSPDNDWLKNGKNNYK